MFQKEVKQLSAAIEEYDNILVITHYNPDGDAIGSAMAMYHYLKKKGKSVHTIVPNDFPDFLNWIKDSEQIVVYNNHTVKANELIQQAQLIICVDFNDLSRLKDLGVKLAETKCKFAIIDHHPDPQTIFNFNIHNIHASATAELVYQYICASADRKIIDKTIAECIFTGIMTDTGCFSHNSSNPETFSIVSDLLTCGINKDYIFNSVYNNFSEARMKLMGYCLNEKMVVLPQYSAAYIWLTKEELDKFNFKTGDTEGFVNIPFAIKGIHISALFTERKDVIRVSLRSRGNFAINTISEKYFEGGGHKNAAGGESKLSMKETLEKFENILETVKNDIQNQTSFNE